MIIQRVFKNKATGQKMATIPARADILEGDFILIKKIEEEYILEK